MLRDRRQMFENSFVSDSWHNMLFCLLFVVACGFVPRLMHKQMPCQARAMHFANELPYGIRSKCPVFGKCPRQLSHFWIAAKNAKAARQASLCPASHSQARRPCKASYKCNQAARLARLAIAYIL